MKNKLSACLQVFVALAMTGSIAYAMKPAQQDFVSSVQSQSTKEPLATTTTQPLATEPVVSTAPKQITWQDNPNKCDLDTEYISSESPFNCIKKPVSAPKPSAQPQSEYVPSGNQYQWLLESGIPQQYWRAVDYIVSRESGWKPCAYYPSKNDCSASPSTACGLVQQLPCGKIPADWRDPVAALKWQYQYVTEKYGGYPQAMLYWQEHGNY